MEKFKSVIFRILIIVTVVLLALLVLFISINSEKVPELYAYTDSRTSKAVTGNYTWYAFSEVLKEENIDKQNITYKAENTLRLYPGEVFSISSHLSSTSRRNFSIEKIVYDSSYSVSVPVEYKLPSNSFSELNVAEITAPTVEDTYYYYFNLSYHEKGKVEYALKVIISSEPKYELEQLLNYKDTKLYDINKIDNILNILPYSNNKTGIIVSYNSDPKKLIINYSDLLMDRETLMNNVLSLFVLIPEVDVIEYKSNDISYIYLRRELELKYGRDLSEYKKDKSLWEAEVFFGEKHLDQNNSLHNLLKSIIVDAVGLESGDKEAGIVVDLKSFDTNTLYTVNEINQELLLMDLCDSFYTVYNMDYGTYLETNNKNIYVEADDIKNYLPSGDKIYISGDIVVERSGDNPLTLHNNEIYLVVIKNNEKKYYKYTCNYVDNSWIYDKENIDNQ